MGDRMSFDSGFLSFFRLQMESFVLGDCWHEEDTYIQFFIEHVRTRHDQYKVAQSFSAHLGQNIFQAVHSSNV